MLERHITLDKSWKGSDHVCSLTPLEFLDLVNQVRIVEAALGNSIKQFQPSEEPCYNKLGKTLVAARDLSAGDHITADSVKVKVAEPKGCPAERYNDIIGKELVRDVQEDESIMSTDVIWSHHLDSFLCRIFSMRKLFFHILKNKLSNSCGCIKYCNFKIWSRTADL